MSLASCAIFDNGLARQMSPGDIPNTNELFTAIANAAGVTWTAAQALAGNILRSGAAGVSDTTPDANSWITAMLQQPYVASGTLTPSGVAAGTSYRLRVISTNTGTLTIVAGTGVTLAGTTTIPTVNTREYVVTVQNGTPQQIFAATTTNASAVVTGMSAAQTQLLSPGMLVSGTGIQAGSLILSVQPGVGVTLSLAATATASLVAITFAPRVEFRGIFTAAN